MNTKNPPKRRIYLKGVIKNITITKEEGMR